MVNIDDFKKLKIVIGAIENVEEVEGSNKLFKFIVDVGTEKRQIIGGFKLSYSAEELLNKQVIVLANLEPRNIMGIESQGMIFAASNENNKPVIISPIEFIPNGSKIK